MRNFITYDWLTIFSCIGLVFIVAAKYLFNVRFNDFIKIVGNSKYLKIYTRDQKFIDGFDSLLFINMVIAVSIFISITYPIFFSDISFNISFFLKLLLTVSTVLLIKILIERLIASLFDMDSLIDHYLFQKVTYKNFCGLILIVANAILLYGIKPSKIVIISIVLILFLINSIGFITSFKNHQKLINPNFFYFLLYLCALEIGPYVILYKVIKEYNA